VAHDRRRDHDVEAADPQKAVLRDLPGRWVIKCRDEARGGAKYAIEKSHCVGVSSAIGTDAIAHVSALSTDREISVIAADIEQAAAWIAPCDLIEEIVVHQAEPLVRFANLVPLLALKNNRRLDTRIG